MSKRDEARGGARDDLGERRPPGPLRRRDLDEPRAVVLERVQRARREDARLAHAAAEHLAVVARLGDERARPGERRADRRAEALGEADVHRVERRGELRRRDARGRGRVPEARAVEVQREAAGARASAATPARRRREDAATGAVVGFSSATRRCRGQCMSGSCITARERRPP